MSKFPYPAYTVRLRDEIERTRQEVRGNNGIAAQSGLAASRVDDIINGGAPTDHEHRMIARSLPRMKHYGNLLLEFRAPVAPAVLPAPTASVVIQPALPLPSAVAPVPAPPRPLTLVPRTFAEWLRAAREREGLAIDELAQLLELSASAVRAWEDDVSAPVEDNYRRLVGVLPIVADGPKPASRDIPKPIGRTSGDGYQAVRPLPLAEVAMSATTGAPDVRALIAFGAAVGRTAGALEAGKGDRAAVVALLRQGDAAGLAAAEIADAIESGGAS